MFPVLQFGPFALSTPLLALLVGVFGGVWLVEREATRLTLPANVVTRMVWVGLAAGVVGARLGYAVRYLSLYAADPLSIVSPNPAALDPAIGYLIGGIVMLIAGQRWKLPLRPTMDALAPGLAALSVAIGVADLASGDAFGAPARLPWSIFLWGAERHPSQVYAIVAALAVYGSWRWLRGYLPATGFGFLVVVTLSAAARIFLEAFRGDSQIVFGGLHAAQVWGQIVLAACMAGFYTWGRSEPSGAPCAPDADAAVEVGSSPHERG